MVVFIGVRQMNIKLLFIFLCFVQINAFSATIYIGRDGESRPIIIDGEIAPGDAEKFRKLAVQRRGVVRLMVNSEGGDVATALQIGEMVNALRADVEVEPGGICASACFFIWLNGASRSAGPADTKTMNFGAVGLHRPFLRNPTESEESTNRQIAVMLKISEYLKVKLIPQKFIDLMMGKSSAEIYWLTRSDLEEIGRVPPQLVELYLARCGTTFDQLLDEKLDAMDRGDRRAVQMWDGRISDFIDCQVGLNESPRRRAYERMRSGWIPKVQLN